MRRLNVLGIKLSNTNVTPSKLFSKQKDNDISWIR